MTTMNVLMQQFPRPGRVEWIGLRPERKALPVAVPAVEAIAGHGLEGDHTGDRKAPSAKRQVTLIMAEHLATAASILDMDHISPTLTRRNIVVRGMNLQALKGQRFMVGEAELQLTDECHPCSRMEENLGPGGYNAMRGHGGWCAIVVNGGQIRVGDAVQVIQAEQVATSS
jgi:MOSC domain-containing protein YiiM